MLFAAVYADLGGSEFAGVATVDVCVLLGITVCEGKPGALYLYHDTVSFFKSMSYIVHGVFYFGYLAWPERFGMFKAISVTATHYIATHQHLVTARGVIITIAKAIGAVVPGKVIWEYVYELYHKICICGGDGGEEIRYNGAGESYRFCKAIRLVDEHIGTAGRKALVVVHIFPCTVKVYPFGIRHRLCGVAGILFKALAVLFSRCIPSQGAITMQV
jgi:hypothetical protein